jgi:hypothetical protein
MGEVFVCGGAYRGSVPGGATVYPTLREALADPAAARVYVMTGDYPGELRVTRDVHIQGCRDAGPGAFEEIEDPDQDGVPRVGGVRVEGAACRLSGLDVRGPVAAVGARLAVENGKLEGLAAENATLDLCNLVVAAEAPRCDLRLRGCQCRVADLELEHDNVRIAAADARVDAARVTGGARVRLQLDHAVFVDAASHYNTLCVGAADSFLDFKDDMRWAAGSSVRLTRSVARLCAGFPGTVRLEQASAATFWGRDAGLLRVSWDATSAYRFE